MLDSEVVCGVATNIGTARACLVQPTGITCQPVAVGCLTRHPLRKKLSPLGPSHCAAGRTDSSGYGRSSGFHNVNDHLSPEKPCHKFHFSDATVSVSLAPRGPAPRVGHAAASDSSIPWYNIPICIHK